MIYMYKTIVYYNKKKINIYDIIVIPKWSWDVFISVKWLLSLRGGPREVRWLRALLEISVRRGLHVDHGQDAPRHGAFFPSFFFISPRFFTLVHTFVHLFWAFFEPFFHWFPLISLAFGRCSLIFRSFSFGFALLLLGGASSRAARAPALPVPSGRSLERRGWGPWRRRKRLKALDFSFSKKNLMNTYENDMILNDFSIMFSWIFIDFHWFLVNFSEFSLIFVRLSTVFFALRRGALVPLGLRGEQRLPEALRAHGAGAAAWTSQRKRLGNVKMLKQRLR